MMSTPHLRPQVWNPEKETTTISQLRSSETKQGNLKKSSTHEMSDQAPMHVGASGASCSVAHLEAKECTVNAPFAKMD